MNIPFIILLLAFVILFAAYVRLARINKRRTHPYSWVRSDKHLPKTRRQVLLFIDEELPNGKTDDFRFRTAFLNKDDEGNPVFTTPGAQYIISNKVWWRDLTAPEKANNKRFNELNELCLE